MSFIPRIEEESSIIMKPMVAQSGVSSLSGRTVVLLPADDRCRKEWDILGVIWLESLDEKPFFAKALLPEGWKTERASTLYSDEKDVTIIDDKGKEQVKIWIETALNNQVVNISFLKIDKKLFEQTEKKESEVIKDVFKPVCYPGYCSKFYCSYDAIIDAIESWGKVEGILMNSSGINHIFIVSFKKPIEFSSYGEGIMVNLSGGHGIFHTPFGLRETYIEGSSSNVILSNNMMAFDINYLRTGTFTASNLWRSQTLLPDERLRQIKEEVGEHANWKIIEKKINSTFSEADRAKKLLEWIKQSGLSILEKGLYRSGNDRIGEYLIDEIVKNYTSSKSFSPWKVITKTEK